MKIKFLLPTIVLSALLAMSAIAQVGRIEGEVKKRENGEPIAGAEVQIHRNDIKWSATIKTDKKGKFVHAGVQYGGTYTLIVGADGFTPDALFNVKPDQQGLGFQLGAGDGKRLTIDEVRATGMKGSSGGGAPAPVDNKAAKKAEEEYKKKVDEVNKKNEKIKADNEAMQKALDGGKALFNNKDFNGAVAEFNRGIEIDPEQNVFWYWKSLTLYNRGVTRLNESLKDPAMRDPAKADLTEAVSTATKATTLLETQMGSDSTKAAQFKSFKEGYLKVRADASSILGKRFSDAAMAEASNKDYLTIAEMTPDAANKKKYLFNGAETLREASLVDQAVAAYKTILDQDPNFIDAYYGIGIAYAGNEKTFQDAANYLQMFVDKAAAGDQRAVESKQVIEALKVGNNIKPSKDAMKILQKEGGGAGGKAPAKKKS